MKIVIFALNDVFDTGLSVLLDTFSTANEVAFERGFKSPPLEVRLVGLDDRVRTAQGLSTRVEPASSVCQTDWVVIPALNIRQPQQLLHKMVQPEACQAMDYIRDWHAAKVGIASACIGTFLLAETGILDSCEATTTWSLAPFFRQRYPAIRLNDSRMVVASHQIVTAGSAMGHIDLALWLLRQASPELATLVARLLLIDNRTSQAEYIIPDYIAHADPLVARFEKWARGHLSLGFSLQAAASDLAVGSRTLQRRTEAVLGKSPLAFFQDLRIERAQHLVAVGYDLDSIAQEVGYADTATLRTLLRRRLGRGMRELRAEATFAAAGASLSASVP